MPLLKHIKFLILLITIKEISCNVSDNAVDCNLSESLKEEIASYAPIVENIINATIYGQFKNFTYDELAVFVDKFGNRIAGSQNLEDAIDYMLERLNYFGLEEVHGEDVEVPQWVRGNESATMLEPRYQNLAILGLGRSIGTGTSEGITAEALVVTSFDELEAVASKVDGKIVVFNQDYVSYGVSVKYRSTAAVRAAKYGAVATLVRSVTPYSLYTPHTGNQNYDSSVKKIPTASITIEDAQMLYRLQQRGEKIILNLKMGAQDLPEKISRNTIAEIKGSTKPEKVVIVSGHLDSWDVGNGAMDDGGGAFMSWASLVVLKNLGLRPKRTLRAILWTAEEEGLVGAEAYAKAHANETDDFNFVMESDEGTFKPLGIEYTGSTEGACIIEEILQLLKPINTTTLEISNSVGSDIQVLTSLGIPGAANLNQNDKYFWYHHTEADTLDVENPEDLDLNTALWAAVSYIIADLSVDFPRDSITIY